MTNASVRAVAARLLAPLLAPLAAVALMTPAAVLGAQAAPRPRFTIGGGASLPGERSFHFTHDVGLHLQLSATWWRAPRWGARVDIGAQMFPGEAAIPGCAPTGPCETLVPHPDQLYSAVLSVELMPFVATPRVYTVAGLGPYTGRGPSSKSFGTRLGAAAGLGLALAGNARRGVAAELRYHRLFDGTGEYSGVLTPSLAVHF